MRRRRIFPPNHRGINSLASDSRTILSYLSDHSAAQRFAIHSFRSFPFIDVGVSQSDRSARHSKQLRKIEMTLYLNDISKPNLKEKTEQAQRAVRFAQQAQDPILSIRLFKNSCKDLGGVLGVRKFAAIFEFFARRRIACGESAVFVEGQPKNVIVGVAARQSGTGEACGKC